MVKARAKVGQSCLASSSGENPKTAIYYSTCGGQFKGLKAWRDHMKQRSLLRKLPERISLPGIGKAVAKKAKQMGVEVPSAGTELDAVYINMTKRTDRKKLITAELKAQGMTARRLSAKTGDEVPESQVTRGWNSALNCLYDTKTLPAEHVMSVGERGCSGSHIAIWQQCAAQADQSKPLLVLEDDAVLHSKAGVPFGEIASRLIGALGQCYDVATEPLMLYVGGEVIRWRDSRRITVDGPPVMKLREAEYLWQTSSYIMWPAAAKVLLSHLPVSEPTDCFISRLVLEGHVTAVVGTPSLAEQRDPYEKGDITHTNLYLADTDDPSKAPYEKDWKFLDEAQRASACALGFSEQAWYKNEWAGVTAATGGGGFGLLKGPQLAAAAALGFCEGNWEA